MKTILVPTDFSPAAVNATDYAAAMAQAMNARLYLLHVYQIPASYGEIFLPVNEVDMTEGAERYMKRLKDQLLDKTGGNVSIDTHVSTGAFFQELKAACEEQKPSAVVMGSQGTTAAERFFFGSHTVYAMKHLMWPLIAVPPGALFSSVKKIGLACDLNKVIHSIPVEEIKMWVKDFHAKLHIINTGRKEDFDPDVVFESGWLQEVFADLKPDYHFITGENTDEDILEFAEKNQIDLLLVLPRRHDLLDKLVHKSHTRQFVLHSHVPVMSLHQ
jgi:nucleotide-binding universal stress UspA family protein